DALFTLKLLSEALHQTQTELYKTAQELKIVQEQRKRIGTMSQAGAVATQQVIEADAQILRHQVATKAYRQELLTRGLTPEQIDAVADGHFVTEIVVTAPRLAEDAAPASFEVQELKVELGQQVPAGQTICLLANHQTLSVEGRAFRDETQLVERAVREGWP